MSVFKTQGIILRVGKTPQREVYYTIFFREYGILNVSKKQKVREKPVDTGYLISCEIYTYNDKKMHTIGNIHILHFFESEGKSYTHIEKYLKIISSIKKEIPIGIPNYEIYDILAHLGKVQKDISTQKLILTHIKILSFLGNMRENHSNITVQKILKFIHANKYSDVLRLGEIPEDTKIILEQLL